MLVGEQGWRIGDCTSSHQFGPGSILELTPYACELCWLLLLVPVPKVFLRVVRFSSIHQNQHFQIPLRLGNSGQSDSVDVPLKLPIFLFYTKPL